MRFYLLLLSLALSVNAYSCDSRMKDYAFECEYQDHFNKLKTDFKTYSISPLELKGYLLPFVLGDRDYYAKKNEYLNHSKENLATNRQWITWKNSQNITTKLNPIVLEITDVVRLQSNLLSTKSLGDIFNTKLGRLRTGNAEINPTITYSCEDEKINNDVIALFNDYDLKTEEGYSLLTIKNIIACKDSKDKKSGQIVFYKNASVRSELNRWLVDFNDTLSRYDANETINVSPYEYLADMRRWFVAISPFLEGNESVAEALMLYATNRLNLPPMGQPKQGTAILFSAEENRNQVMKRMKESLTFFEGCLFETKTKFVSEECRSLI